MHKRKDYWDRLDDYRQLEKDGELDPHLEFAEAIKPDDPTPKMDRSDIADLRSRAKVS